MSANIRVQFTEKARKRDEPDQVVVGDIVGWVWVPTVVSPLSGAYVGNTNAIILEKKKLWVKPLHEITVLTAMQTAGGAEMGNDHHYDRRSNP